MTVSILKVSIRQIKAARALLGWSQDQLAGASGVSIPTVKRLEARDGDLGGRQHTTERLRQALEAAGIEFANGEQPGVRLRVQSGGAIERVMEFFEMYLDLPKDLGPDELSKEASAAWKLAEQGYSRENFKAWLAQMVSKRFQQPLDLSACDRLAGAILALCNRPLSTPI